MIQNLYVNKSPDFIDMTMWVELNYIEKTWEELSKTKKLVPVLIALVKGEKNLYSIFDNKKVNVSRSLKRLINTGLISKTKDSIYQWNDPLLRYWIRKTILKMQ